MRETNSLWELGQTPLSEKLQNDTSADRVPTDFRNWQRKDFIILLLKSTKIKSSSNFSHLQLSTAPLRAEEKEKNSLFLYHLYVRRTTSYGKRVEQQEKFVLSLLGSPFTRWMGATGGKKDQRPKSDEKVTSYHQKCQWKKFADFLLLKNSKPLDVKLFSIGSVYSCVQTPKAGKSIRWNKLACRSIGKRVSETRSTTELTCSTAGAKTIHYGTWDKYRWVKNYTRHL